MYLIEVEHTFRACRKAAAGKVEQSAPDLETIGVRLQVIADRVSGAAGKSIELSNLEQILRSAVSDFDGRWLADLDVFAARPVSLENLAQFLYNKLEIMLEHCGVRIDSVTLELPQKRQKVTFRK